MSFSQLRLRTSPWVLLIFPCIFVAAGCQPEPAPAPPVTANAPPPLRLLVIGDQELAKVIKREWDARSEGELNLRELSIEQFSKYELPRLGADAVIFPSEAMGELAGRGWLAPLSNAALEDPAVQFQEIFSSIRKQESQWGEETYAIPLGGAPLVLFYRRDILEKLSLQPPQDWVEYMRLAGKLHQRESVRDFLSAPAAKWQGVCEPLRDEWAAQLLLARAAPYCKHRSQFSALFDYRTLQPLIAGPPFVRALQELAEAAKSGGVGQDLVSPAESLRRLIDGECALAIGSLVEFGERRGETSSQPSLDIGVAPLPGARDVYNFRSAAWEQRDAAESSRVPLLGMAGRQSALTKECRQPAAAVRLLLWLSGRELSPLISSASYATAPFRASHLTQVEKWTGRLLSPVAAQQYASAVQQSLSEPNGLIGLRIPGSHLYLAALSEAVRSAVAEQVPPEQALQEVARQWETLNAALDREKQRLSYMQSIGLKP